MANYYDPYSRRPQRPANRGNRGQSVTMADYQQLVQAYQELQGQAQELQKRQQATARQLETQSAELKNTKTELQVKDEAFKRQSADFKEIESELVWAKAAVKQLQEELDAAGEENEEEKAEEAKWQDKYARLQAEFENYRRRGEQRTEQRIAEAKHQILLDMLPLADHLDLAMNHTDSLQDGAARDFVASIEATRRAFLDTLKRYGVQRIDPAGEPFDPVFHEAVGQIADEKTPADKVAQVMQAGYREDDRVIRPARVLVSSGTQASQDAGGEEPLGGDRGI
jgi:molecular chaperone GrpE